MNLDTKLQAKLKELDAIRTQIAANDEAKQKLLSQGLEIQGAVKQLIELVNEQKAAEARTDVVEAASTN